MTPNQRYNLAVKQHQAGRLAEAENLYRQVLAEQPHNADALNMAGALQFQLGKPQQALTLIDRALELNPGSAVIQFNRAVILTQLGRYPEAEAICRQILEKDPNAAGVRFQLANICYFLGKLPEAIAAYEQILQREPTRADVFGNLGGALRQVGRFADALACFREAARLQPSNPTFQGNLAVALSDNGQYDAAMAAFQTALAALPQDANLRNNYGNTLCAMNRFDEAIAAYRQALAVQPNYHDAWNNLGNALREKGRFDESIAAYGQALAAKANSADAYSNLAYAQMEKGLLDEALVSAWRATELAPGFASGHLNLGRVLASRAEYEPAIQAFRKTLELQPNNPLASWNLGLLLLMRGEYAQGWPLYDARWQARELRMAMPQFPQPLWDGKDLAGKRLLLYDEQGFGDALQFARFAPLAARRGAQVIIACHPALVRLLRSIDGVAEVVPRDQRLPQFDVHYPLIGLAGLLRVTLENLPATVPYLHPDATLARRWQARLPQFDSRLKIGLVWAGNVKPDRKRTISARQFARLADAEDAWFCSLQKRTTGQVEPPPPELNITDWTQELADFADTAGLVSNLDLVITIDTAVAHLSAALGRPTWVLLPYVSDWRWMLSRSDSPWYPTLRLFRQPTPGDWDTPMQQLIEALHDFRA